MSKEKEMFTIVISVEKSVLKYFGEQKYYNGFVSQKEVDGKMQMTFVTCSMMGFAKYYLLFAEHADIISPGALKEMVQQNLISIQQKLSS
jgi:predicted DNA-binding transcriptional regulator YafY